MGGPMSPRVRCVTCDAPVARTDVSPRGWCLACEDEFEKVMNLVPGICQNCTCTSPLACVAANKCLKVWAGQE